MHEWALAEAIISTACRVAADKKFTEITEIKIKLGQLQQIDFEIFQVALQEIMQAQRQLLPKTKIELESAPVVLECRCCRYTWNGIDDLRKTTETESEAIHFVPELAHVYMRCPQCSSSDFKIESGRGVWIDSITGID